MEGVVFIACLFEEFGEFVDVGSAVFSDGCVLSYAEMCFGASVGLLSGGDSLGEVGYLIVEWGGHRDFLCVVGVGGWPRGVVPHERAPGSRAV